MKERGATLLEILIAMLIVALVAGGILSAFVFSRRVTLRSGAEMTVDTLAQEVAEDLRLAVAGNTPNLNIPLAEGIYIGTDYVGDPPANSTALATLNFPPQLARFLREDGDGRMVIIEENNDLDGDGFAGQDLDGDGTVDLRRVRVEVNFTTPSAGEQ